MMPEQLVEMPPEQLLNMTWTELECWTDIYRAAKEYGLVYRMLLLDCLMEQLRRSTMISVLKERWSKREMA